MTLKGVYIDDENPEGLAEVLTSDAIKFSAKKEILDVSTFTDELLKDGIDILVVDYRLDLNKSAHGNKNHYRAGLLAQSIRERVLDTPEKDFPIVLVSSEDNIKSFSPDKTAHDLFDQKYKKESLTEEAFLGTITTQLDSLSLGYKEIYKQLGKKEGAQTLLALNKDDEVRILDETNIPLQIREAKAPHIAARQILAYLIRRTGLLLNPNDVFARLGMKASQAEKENEWIFSILEERGCLYQGVFSSGWKRVWRHRFDQWAEELLGKPVTSIQGDERISLLSAKLGREISPAVSKWSNSSKELFSFACASCGYPTEIKHSLAAQEDASTKYLEKRRVCFDCIQTDQFEKAGLYLAASDHGLVEKIKSHIKKSAG